MTQAASACRTSLPGWHSPHIADGPGAAGEEPSAGRSSLSTPAPVGIFPVPWTSWQVGQETTPFRATAPSGPYRGYPPGTGRDGMTFTGCPPSGTGVAIPFDPLPPWHARHASSPLSPFPLFIPHIQGGSPVCGTWHGSHTLFPTMPRRSCGVRATDSCGPWHAVQRNPFGR